MKCLLEFLNLNLTTSVCRYYRDTSNSDHTKISTSEDSPTKRIRTLASSSLAEASLRCALASISVFEAYVTKSNVRMKGKLLILNRQVKNLSSFKPNIKKL